MLDERMKLLVCTPPPPPPSSSVRYSTFDIMYTAISIKVVPKTREKVEYERERLFGKD